MFFKYLYYINISLLLILARYQYYCNTVAYVFIFLYLLIRGNLFCTKLITTFDLITYDCITTITYIKILNNETCGVYVIILGTTYRLNLFRLLTLVH